MLRAASMLSAVALGLCLIAGPAGPSYVRRPLEVAPAAPSPAPPALGWAAQAPPRARARALDAAREHGLVDAPGQWIAAGPTNVGGRVTALGVDPNDPARIWIGTAAGGVFVSADEGSSFTPVFDAQTALSIGSLAVHPTSSDVVYVGTGEDNGAGYTYDGEGVFKTVDGGATWTDLGLAETRRIGGLAVDPTDGDRLFAAAGGNWYVPDNHRGIYRSTDGGDSWQQVLFVADDTGGIDVEIDPSNPSRVFATVWQRMSEGDHWHVSGPLSGVYRSVDGGDSWTRLSSGLPTEEMGKIGLAIAPGEPNVVYANIISPQNTLLGIYRSTDGGDSWERRDRPSVGDWYGSFGYYFSGVEVDPTDADTVYFLDVRLLRSTNGGRTVGNVTNAAHVDWHALSIGPGGRLLAGNDGGFWRSPDGSSWIHSETLPITQFYDLGIDAQDPLRRFAGSQDNGTLRTLTGGTDDWDKVLPNDGLQCEVDPTDSNKVYASEQAGLLYRSTDGGATFSPATDGIDRAERVNWNAPLTLDPTTPSTIYTGTTRVYRSIDSMASWAPISPDLTVAASSATTPRDDAPGADHAKGLIRGTVTVVEVSPVDPDVLWAGTDNGHVWVTSDAGANWSQVDPPAFARWVTDIEADHGDADTAYLTASGHRTGDRSAYVAVTEDRGQTWREVGASLPQVPVNAVAVDTDWVGRWFVGTDLGVYVSDDLGTSWSAMRDGMPYAVTLDLYRHDPTDRLFAATYGRSAFTFELSQLGPADGDGDGVDNNQDCAPADGGSFAPPDEEPELAVDRGPAGASDLSWTSLAPTAGPGTVYDVARGDLDDLRSSGSTAASIGRVCRHPATTFSDPYVPPSGNGVYYLVRGANACGKGGWGTDSAGESRTSTACP